MNVADGKRQAIVNIQIASNLLSVMVRLCVLLHGSENSLAADTPRGHFRHFREVLIL